MTVVGAGAYCGGPTAGCTMLLLYLHCVQGKTPALILAQNIGKC